MVYRCSITRTNVVFFISISIAATFFWCCVSPTCNIIIIDPEILLIIYIHYCFLTWSLHLKHIVEPSEPLEEIFLQGEV